MMRLGTRASTLARTQSAWVARQLVAGGEGDSDGFQLVNVSTHGDRDRTSPLTRIGGTGVFVSAVREALLAGEVDVVVHSLKDLPTLPADGIRLAAIPVRENPADALVTREGVSDLAAIPHGGRVGTGSPRRAAQLMLARPDLEIVPIRGNIETRMAFAERGELDAVVLAAAGLLRLGLNDRIAEVFHPWQFLPAPAQGALAVEVREDLDPESALALALSALDHAPTRFAVAAERALLRALEAGCSAPVATFAEVTDDDRLLLKAGVYGRNTTIVRDIHTDESVTAASAEAAGRALAEDMLAAGARDLLAEEWLA
ncbi:porphobilinogen deaminase [Dermabacter vaginalis]|uniref:Porphobilinogen deaminase n=1 Tax=Dermabacter vaginalis TaxID=1630135 RepID=A0A1B0ZKL1_9MICO|nr:hydroxymethylbilane synthase [Dermabacter vaginalis]ANP28480.1 porphobilinogen deaminase [Dermabacter vaginalis]